MILLLIAITLCITSGAKVAPKYYTCESNGSCQLHKGDASAGGMSQNTCMMVCGQGSLWPYPTGKVAIDESYVHINPSQLTFDVSRVESYSGPLRGTVNSFFEHFQETVALMDLSAHNKVVSKSFDKGLPMYVQFDIADSSVHVMALDVDETYSLSISTSTDNAMSVSVTITAVTVFGGRHALETLSQLVAWEDVSLQPAGLVVASSVAIEGDGPQFPYRGVMLDLSRSFKSIAKIYKVVDAMSYNKMNILHIHISDSASFPVELSSQPNITYFGAYSEQDAYSLAELAELVRYCHERGVMILPEIDGPSHVAAGFEWGSDAGLGKLAICDDPSGMDGRVWTQSGLEPPSGQLNLANEQIYSVMADVYSELAGVFTDVPAFHVGGDEIIVGSDDNSQGVPSCYNSSEKAAGILVMLAERGLSRTDPDSFYLLWHEYIDRVATLVRSAFGFDSGDTKSNARKLHIWGGAADGDEELEYDWFSRVDVTTVLPPAEYIVQVWDSSDGSVVPQLLNQEYQVVLSNADYVYLDCGNAGWTNPGGYYCQPYHEWYHLYEYITDVVSLWELSPASIQRILGSETLTWSEMIDDTNLEQKLWPRSAALAEALWGRSNATGADGRPSKTGTWYAADPRFQHWRNVLVQRGISAEAIQAQWCSQRGAYACTVDEGTPQ